MNIYQLDESEVGDRPYQIESDMIPVEQNGLYISDRILSVD